MSDELSSRADDLLAQALGEQLAEQRALREIAASLAGVANAVDAILAERLSELSKAVSRVEARLEQMEQRLVGFALHTPLAGEERTAPLRVAQLATLEAGARLGLGSGADPLLPEGAFASEKEFPGDPEPLGTPLPDILRAPPQERPIPQGGRLGSRRKGKRR